MIVPRSFSAQGITLNEKSDHGIKRSSSRSRTRSRSTSPFSLRSASIESLTVSDEHRSNPVLIPSRKTKPATSTPDAIPLSTQSTDDSLIPKLRRGSAKDVLSSTTIPARRKIRGRPSQRLPKGDHVADFSKLMLDDIRSKDGSLSRSFSGSYTDALFGNIDGLVEGQMIVGSEGLDESILATRSISSESLASLASPEDYGSSGLTSQLSTSARSYETRRIRRLGHSQDCATDHPLVTAESGEEPRSTDLPIRKPTITLAAEKKPRSFKSSLTASLKAIKTAAQSVSSKASLFATPDSTDFLARSFFDIQPFLTDDKRPPPADSLPSAQLRRYLNPVSSNVTPDSPANLHFWQDERAPNSLKQGKKSKSKIRRNSARNGIVSSSPIDSLPSVVQLSTCLPPSIRTANASSPPIWLNPDGTPSNKQTANLLQQNPNSVLDSTSNQPRHREPRENRDFLRIFVCEMEMRRHGKLSDDTSIGRARLWLPPVADNFKGASGSTASSSDSTTELDGESGAGLQGAERWRSWTADDL